MDTRGWLVEYSGSARHFDSFEDYAALRFRCPCGWEGAFEELARGVFGDLFDASCRRCGTMLAIVSFPTEDEVREAAQEGNEEAKDELEGLREREELVKRYQERELTRPEQLPELEGLLQGPDRELRVRAVPLRRRSLREPEDGEGGAAGMVALTDRFSEALAFATRVHAGQLRKGTSVPYVSHVLAVCALVLEDGGGEDEAIAALLHDAVEDGGGRSVLEEIRQRFGDEVAEIVWGCSDTDETPKPPWKERKRAYIAHVREAGPAVRRVSCADKLHNARSILRDYRDLGEALWGRFNASGPETLWYYRELVAVFRDTGGGPMVEELQRVVSELERLVTVARSRSQQ